MFLDCARLRWAIRGLPDPRLAMAFYRIGRHTMTRPARAKALWKMCRTVLHDNVPGDFVECGVWRGGSAGLMGLALQSHPNSGGRRLHLYDSFEGLPPPSLEDGEMAENYWRGTTEQLGDSSERCVASIETVKELLFTSLGLASEMVVFHPGWFENTIGERSSLPLKIAVLRLDGDWYESTKVCLESLYDHVSLGGVVMLDDYYCWDGCRRATDEFRRSRSIETPLARVDADSAYWFKG